MSSNYTITATGDGGTSALYLTPGDWSVQIAADTWGGSTTATLQSSIGNDVFVGVRSPYGDGSTDFVLTANGPMIGVQGGLYVRLSVSNYSGSSNLRLIAQRA